MSDDNDTFTSCIGYGITPHAAPRVSDDESLCPDCLSDLIADRQAGRPLRGTWRVHVPGQPDQPLRPAKQEGTRQTPVLVDSNGNVSEDRWEQYRRDGLR